MKTFNVYGCSWTQGIQSQELETDSWVAIAAAKQKNHTWKNWARAGCSVQYCSFLLDAFTYYRKENDFVIFQITQPGRLTYWEHYIFNKVKDKIYFNDYGKTDGLPNYSFYGLDEARNKFGNITPGDIPNGYSIRKENGIFYKDKPELARLYYTAVETEQQYYEWHVFIEHVKKYADFLYFHHDHPSKRKENFRFIENKFDDIPCFRDELGHDEYSKYQIDDGKHLNARGNEILADWVLEKIKDKL